MFFDQSRITKHPRAAKLDKPVAKGQNRIRRAAREPDLTHLDCTPAEASPMGGKRVGVVKSGKAFSRSHTIHTDHDHDTSGSVIRLRHSTTRRQIARVACLGMTWVRLTTTLLCACETYSPIPKRVVTWAGISNAKALVIVWRDRSIKNSKHKCRTTTIVAVCAARYAAIVLPRHFCLIDGLIIESCPPNDPKRHCGSDSDPASRSFW